MCNCKNDEFMIDNNQLCVWNHDEGEFFYSSTMCYKFCPICGENLQPERSKREDLIEMIVPPEPDKLTKMRLEQDIEFVKSRCGVSSDLLGCGALNSMET